MKIKIISGIGKLESGSIVDIRDLTFLGVPASDNSAGWMINKGCYEIIPDEKVNSEGNKIAGAFPVIFPQELKEINVVFK